MTATLPAAIEKNNYELLTPEEIFDLYRAGDTEAGAELARQIIPALFTFLFHYLGEIPAAEKALRDSLSRLAERAERFNPLLRFNTFLYQIAREAAIDAMAASPANNRALAEIFSDNLPVNPTVEDLGQRLAGAVGALPLPQKDVFLLREDADLTFGEISEILDCSAEQTQNHLRAAFGNLAAALDSAPPLRALLNHL